MLKAVCYDLDDTIYPHKDFEFSVFKQISDLVHLRYDVSADAYYNELVHLFNAKLVNRTFDAAIERTMGFIPTNWDHFVVYEILPAYRSHKPRLQPFDDVIHLIGTLKKNNLLTALITNGNTVIQNNKIDCLGIRPLFDRIYISDEFEPPARKPSLVMFEKFLGDTGLQGGECLYIGDDLEKDRACEKLGIVFMQKINGLGK